MVNMSAKFDKEIHNGLVYRVHKLIFIYVHCVLDLWPPLTVANMSAKFDQEAHNG